MAIPATGTTYKAGGYGTVDNRFYARGGLCAVLMRDNRGIATNMSPYAAGTPPTPYWAPFASDGQLRNDMFAWVRNSGLWQLNGTTNDGWWLLGAQDERGGPERKPAIKHDDAMILQSNFPFDTDLTGEGISISFTGVEVINPLLKRLRMNLPLSDPSGNPIVELPGKPGFVLSKPLDADAIDRQLLLIFARRKQGKWIYTAEGYPWVKLTDIGNIKRDKTGADAAALTFTALPDPYMVDIDPTLAPGNNLVPVMYSEWTAGDGWTALGGNPVFPGLAPKATALTTGTAEVEFMAAVGAGTITYTVQKFQSGSWSAATIGTVQTDTPVAGALTIPITGLAAGSAKFHITATANTLSTVSADSNTVTIL